MQLNEREKRIFCALQLRANVPLSEISKLTGYKEYSVRRTVASMLERKVFYASPTFEMSGLGLEKYELFLQISPKQGQSLAMIEKAMSTSSIVRWMGKVAGDYNYWLWLHVKEYSQVEKYFDDLTQQFGMIFAKKLMGRYVSWSQFSKKYLIPSMKLRDVAGSSASIAVYNLSDQDKKIISFISHSPLCSLRYMSQRLGIADSTIGYRLNCLRQSKIVADPFLRLSYAYSGVHAYLIRIKSKYPSLKFMYRIFEYARQHLNVVVFTHHTGEWDYGLTVEVEDPAEIHTIMSELNTYFSDSFESIILLSRFDPIKATVDPMEALPQSKQQSIEHKNYYKMIL